MMHDIAKGIGGLIIIFMIVGFLDYHIHMPNVLFGLVTGLLCYIVADFMQEEYLWRFQLVFRSLVLVYGLCINAIKIGNSSC